MAVQDGNTHAGKCPICGSSTSAQENRSNSMSALSRDSGRDTRCLIEWKAGNMRMAVTPFDTTLARAGTLPDAPVRGLREIRHRPGETHTEFRAFPLRAPSASCEIIWFRYRGGKA